MSYSKQKSSYGKREYSVIYNNFKGVDFSENISNISDKRLAYAENMYCDYDGSGEGIIESIPGYRKIYDVSSKINGLYSYKNSIGEDILVIHGENKVYQLPISKINSTNEIKAISGIGNSEGDYYCYKDAVFILDGNGIFMISDSFSGNVNLSDKIYIPTTHINGEEYEQRNILTRHFYEKYSIHSVDVMAHGTPSLKYTITDIDRKECSVCGIEDDDSIVYIPARVEIGNTYYAVKSIEDYAFEGNTKIQECYIANGVYRLNKGAFKNCSALKKVVLSETVSEILNSCFSNCTALRDLHIGASLKIIDATAFASCSALERISYSLSNAEFQAISNANTLTAANILYNVKINSLTIGMKIHNPTSEIISVSDGESQLEFSVVKKDSLCKWICIYLADKNAYNGKMITVKGLMSSNDRDYSETHGFITSHYKATGNISEIITRCRIAESFDGRIFLTGNPDYPGFCFYSALDSSGENHPLYFGEMNYFKDGIGNFANTAMLAVGDSLAVFKERDDGGGSIYYHTPKATGIDAISKVYPVSYVHSGFVAKGKAISFFDDPVFVSSKGISALAKKNINLERSIATRSSNVNKNLLLEDLSSIKLAIWKGYLVVLSKDKIYLADSRSSFVTKSGEMEYEWYYLSGIGSYKNDNKVYRYSPFSHSGFLVHENIDKKTKASVYSIKVNKETVYYTNENGKRYEVYATEERDGGTFSPATHIICIDERLIFATGDGQVFVFNNDMHGIAPPYLCDEDGFNEEEYRAVWGNKLHPYYYSFAGHAVRYALQTKIDNCSIPHLLKNTVKNSLSVKCKAVSSGKIICEVGTDNGGYKELARFPSRDLFFADIDFSSFSLSTDDVYTIPINEREKGWIEKQITLYSEEFASPFAVCIIAYRFYVKGNIKKHR